MAACIPDVEGQQADSLWDTGDQVTLVEQLLANALLKCGAKVQNTRQPLRVKGIGNGAMISTQQMVATVRFDDKKSCLLVAWIVPICLMGLISGSTS